MSDTFQLPKAPEVKFNKNGYEIRTEILNISLQRVAEYLAPLGLHFPEFAAPVRFDHNGQVL